MLPGTSFNNSTIARSQLLRPFPEFGDILTTNNDGRTWYHAGQFQLVRRFAQGYSVQASYTWSKWMQQTEYLNQGDFAPTKMISDQDTPHRFSMSALYALPFGKGRTFFKDANFLTNAIVGGWQVQGVYSMQSGFPIAFGAFNIATGATSGDLFYVGGDPSIPSDQRGTARWFNTAAFLSLLNTTSANATPVSHLRTLPYRFSNVRRDFINNFDLAVLKDIQLRETMKIQIRFELINALNEPYFPAPVTTATASNFGQISASNQDNYARRAQIGLKFLF